MLHHLTTPLARAFSIPAVTEQEKVLFKDFILTSEREVKFRLFCMLLNCYYPSTLFFVPLPYYSVFVASSKL